MDVIDQSTHRSTRYIDRMDRHRLGAVGWIFGHSKPRIRPIRSMDVIDQSTHRSTRHIDRMDRHRLGAVGWIFGHSKPRIRPIRSMDVIDQSTHRSTRHIDRWTDGGCLFISRGRSARQNASRERCASVARGVRSRGARARCG